MLNIVKYPQEKSDKKRTINFNKYLNKCKSINK